MFAVATSNTPNLSDLAGQRWSAAGQLLRDAFGVDFSIWDAATGRLLVAASDSVAEEQAGWGAWAAAADDSPYFAHTAGCLAVLAVPLHASGRERPVAMSAFVVRPPEEGDALAAADVLGLAPPDAAIWLERQPVRCADLLLRTARLAAAGWQDRQRLAAASLEQSALLEQLSAAMEDVSLLYSVAHRLRISHSEDELGQSVLDQLLRRVPAQAVAIQFNPRPDYGGEERRRQAPSVCWRGRPPMSDAELAALLARRVQRAGAEVWVANQDVTGAADWRWRAVRQIVAAPIAEGRRLFGWLVALNHRSGEEFGTVEANLMSSLAAIFGAHCSNLALYREQAALLSSVVRALASAIDAKDPYTCGHSDRVGRIAVRLAQELKLPESRWQRVYMAGLLHDIGKIGVLDPVLRKQGPLTDAEFQHVQRHPELGYRILADLKHLDDILPAVLHHHERWDGRGYPRKLAGERIPLLARIIAVADAYDAMVSDRPYRGGMPDEKVEAIFRRGAGRQWDPQIVDALFAARDDIRAIVARQRS